LVESAKATDTELDGIQAKVEKELEEAIQFAEAGEDVQADDFWQFIYDEGGSHA
jgi:TPP-dependent pyruvate/acetoin dehydrogenase alpha subunit